MGLAQVSERTIQHNLALSTGVIVKSQSGQFCVKSEQPLCGTKLFKSHRRVEKVMIIQSLPNHRYQKPSYRFDQTSKSQWCLTQNLLSLKCGRG